jgi:hypothetical protein
MADQNEPLMVEVGRIARAVKDQWLIKGGSTATSWVMWAEYLRGGHGIEMSGSVAAAVRNMPKHLRVFKYLQVGGQQRKVLCVRLKGGFGIALMAVNPNRVSEERRQLLWACKEHLADLITELVFGTGDGQQPASAFRALHGEMTGYTLPMFCDPEVVPPSPLIEPDIPIVPLSDAETLRQFEELKRMIRIGAQDEQHLWLDYMAKYADEIKSNIQQHALLLEQWEFDSDSVRTLMSLVVRQGEAAQRMHERMNGLIAALQTLSDQGPEGARARRHLRYLMRRPKPPRRCDDRQQGFSF